MLHQNQRVVDNPVYLCDLGASLSAAEPEDLQKIMEEMDVSFIFLWDLELSFTYQKNLQTFISSDPKTSSLSLGDFEKRIGTF